MESHNFDLPLPHIVIVPTPGMGHLIPLVEFVKRILEFFPFQFTFIIPSLGPPTQAQKSVLAGLPKAQAKSFFLPSVTLDDLPANSKIETKICRTFARSLPALRSRLRDLQGSHHKLTALVVDLLGTDAFDVALEFGMKPYLFFTTTSLCLSFLLHLPILDGRFSYEFKDMQEPVALPGCQPIYGKDFVDPVQDRKDEAYKWVLHHGKRYTLAEGILINSFIELEDGALKYLQCEELGLPPVYPVGPLVQTGSNDDNIDGSESLKWLDGQPRGSVLFVSFGSGGTLSYSQIVELAHGLERSDQRFLWVLRNPNNESLNATYFTTEGNPKSPLDFLPNGFLDRTKHRGLVIPLWAPQIEILRHTATGGFLTHCGWNSILESVVHGVPLIAWPLYAEQKMNAIMLTESMKIALRPNIDDNGIICQKEIAMVIKGLMEGERGKEIRTRMKELKDATTKVVGVDGSSTKALFQVAQKWK